MKANLKPNAIEQQKKIYNSFSALQLYSDCVHLQFINGKNTNLWHLNGEIEWNNNNNHDNKTITNCMILM